MRASSPELPPPYPLESAFSQGTLWTDRLRRGMWPKPILFWVVAVYLAVFVFRPWEVLVPELGALRFERAMVILVLGWTVACRGFMLPCSRQNITMGVLVLTVFLSYFNAFNPAKTMTELTEFVGIALSFFVICKAVRTPYQLFFLIACYFVATALYVFKSEWEYFLHGNAVWMMGVKRLQGICATHGHPNSFAATMLCSLPIAVFFVRARPSFCQSWPRRRQWLFSRMAYLYIGCALAGVFLTRSRSMTLGLVVFAFLFAIRRERVAAKLKYFAMGMTVIVVALCLGPKDIRLRMQTLVDPSVEYKNAFKGANTSVEGRWEGFVASLEAFQRNPVLGVGLGSFLDYRIKHLDGVPLNAHNLPGELLGETGVLGTLAFTSFLFVMMSNMRRLTKLGRKLGAHSGDFIYAHLGTALLDATLLLLWGGLSSHNLQKYQWYWFAAFAALAVGFAKRQLDGCQDTCSSHQDDPADAELVAV